MYIALIITTVLCTQGKTFKNVYCSDFFPPIENFVLLLYNTGVDPQVLSKT